MASHPQDAISIINAVKIVSIAENNSFVIRGKRGPAVSKPASDKKKKVCNIKWL